MIKLFIQTPYPVLPHFFPSVPSPLPPLGVVSLSQALCSSDDYSNSLLHLDLSKNPGVLSGEDATVRNTHTDTYTVLIKKFSTLYSFLVHFYPTVFMHTF